MSRKTGTIRKRSVFIDGFAVNNPFLTMCLGLGAFLPATHSVKTAVTFGLLMIAELILTSVVISALKRIIPDGVRIPCYVMIIAGSITAIDMYVRAYIPAVNGALGLYLPQLLASSLAFGHAELYARKNSMINSAIHAAGTGLAFFIVSFVSAVIRELLGSGYFFGIQVIKGSSEPIRIFQTVPGALFILALIAALFNKAIAVARQVKEYSEKAKEAEKNG